jgi:uncharacterized protein with PhoU and TrkA domain
VTKTSVVRGQKTQGETRWQRTLRELRLLSEATGRIIVVERKELLTPDTRD